MGRIERKFSVTLHIAIGAVSVLLCGCDNDAPTVKIPVPVRACVVNGSPWTLPGDPLGAASRVSQMMDDVNAIWSSTGVAFLFLPEPRVIEDPQPPGMPLNVPPYVAKGQLGDIRMDDTRGYGSDEAQSAIERCNEAWNPGVAPDVQPGFTVVFVRELIWTDGGPTPHAGYSADLSAAYGEAPLALCQRPYQVAKRHVAGRWSIIETYDRNYHGPAPNLAVITAHELAHDLLLRHGDGLDAEQNGVWDELCDAAEISTGASLMDTYPGSSTTITPLQRELAEAAAAAVVLP